MDGTLNVTPHGRPTNCFDRTQEVQATTWVMYDSAAANTHLDTPDDERACAMYCQQRWVSRLR
jgi:hypothetical protein